MYFETPKKNRKNRSISKPKPLQQSSSLEKKGQKEKENNYGNKNGAAMNNLNANSQNNSKFN
jgi:hypothetical protein